MIPRMRRNEKKKRGDRPESKNYNLFKRSEKLYSRLSSFFFFLSWYIFINITFRFLGALKIGNNHLWTRNYEWKYWASQEKHKFWNGGCGGRGEDNEGLGQDYTFAIGLEIYKTGVLCSISGRFLISSHNILRQLLYN